MNWYKKAQIENYPLWLAQKIIEETSQFKHTKHKKYPGATFNAHDIQLVKEWVENTNPNLENLSLAEAIEQAKNSYGNKNLPTQLKIEDIDKNNIILALQDHLIEFSSFEGQIDEGSIKIKSVKSIYPDVSKITKEVFNYTVTIELNLINNDKTQKYEAVCVTKDGKYFSFVWMKAISS